MSAIGNCPWCNHRAILFSNLAREVTFVRCNNQLCGAKGPEMSTRDLAITAWNRLATPGQGEVRGMVRWDGQEGRAKAAFLGHIAVGIIYPLTGDGWGWRVTKSTISGRQPTEAAARAALEAAVREAINAD